MAMGLIQIGDIAKMENIPQRFLESILLELKKMGILGSKLRESWWILPDKISG
jgi:DNA-binding IscR family transcriptional regulator